MNMNELKSSLSTSHNTSHHISHDVTYHITSHFHLRKGKVQKIIRDTFRPAVSRYQSRPTVYVGNIRSAGKAGSAGYTASVWLRPKGPYRIRPSWHIPEEYQHLNSWSTDSSPHWQSIRPSKQPNVWKTGKVWRDVARSDFGLINTWSSNYCSFLEYVENVHSFMSEKYVANIHIRKWNRKLSMSEIRLLINSEVCTSVA
jgi:hypothetical protein